jgi:hypothetical protein
MHCRSLVAKSTPDGHTLLVSFTSHTINATLYPKLPFDRTKVRIQRLVWRFRAGQHSCRDHRKIERGDCGSARQFEVARTPPK